MSHPATEPSWRRVTSSVLLVVLFFVAALANAAVWLQATISNTDDFVAALQPVPEDVSVAQVLGQSIANAAVDPEQTASDLSGSLPDQLQPLAVPIATAVNEVAARAATRVIESDAFEAVWGRMLQAAHTALLDLLAVRNEVQVLVVDVTEAADHLADRLENAGIDVTVPDAPTITIFQAGQSPLIFNLLRFVYTTGWIFPVAFLVLAVAIFLLRRERRMAAASLGLVTAGAMLFDLVLMRILRGEISDLAADALGNQAIGAVWDTVTIRLRWQTWIILALGLVVAGIARYAGADSSPTPAMAGFLRRWGTLTQAAVVVLALLAMLLVPSMTAGLALLMAAVAALIVFFVSLGKQRAELGGSMEEEPIPARID